MSTSVSYTAAVGDVPSCTQCGRRGQDVWLEIQNRDNGDRIYGACQVCRNPHPEAEHGPRCHSGCVRSKGHHGPHRRQSPVAGLAYEWWAGLSDRACPEDSTLPAVSCPACSDEMRPGHVMLCPPSFGASLRTPSLVNREAAEITAPIAPVDDGGRPPVELEPWKSQRCKVHARCVRHDGHHGKHVDASGDSWDYGACSLSPLVRDCPKCAADEHPIRPAKACTQEPPKWRPMQQMSLFA